MSAPFSCPRRRRPGVLLTLSLVAIVGCSDNEVARQEPGETPQKRSAPNTTDVGLLADDGAAKTGASAGSARKESATGEGILRWATEVYRQAETYADAGEAVMRYKQAGQPFEQRFPLSVAFQRPNKLRLTAYEGLVVSDGERIYATFDDVKGYYLAAAAPPKLTPQDVYADGYLQVMLTQRLAGAAPQLSLLLVENGYNLLTGQAEGKPKLMEQAAIDGRAFHRVRLDTPEGSTVFWIDAESGLLRRVEYPLEGLRQHLEQNGEVSELSVVAEFPEVRVNQPLDESAFAFAPASGAKEVRRFVGPSPPEILGTKPGDFEFVSLEGEKITAESLAGKVVLLDFWATWCEPCLENMPNLARLSEKYKDNDQVRILAVNIQEAETSDDAIRKTMADLKADVPLARDPNQHAFEVFNTTGIPNLYLLGPQGKVQAHQMGMNPYVEPVAHLSEQIDALLAGEDLAAQRLEEFERQMMEAPTVEESAANEPAPAEERVAEQSPPEKHKLTKLWAAEEVRQPGNVYVLESEDGPRILVHDGWETIVELDGEGNVLARRDLRLPEASVVTFLRTAVDGKGRRYYALSAIGQQKLHVFDADWQLLFSFPEEGTHPGVFDVQLADMDGDGALELAVSYLDVVGVQLVSLEGKRIWSNRSLRDVFSLAVSSADEEGHRMLLCTHSQGTLASLTHDGKRGRELTLENQFLRLARGADLDGANQGGDDAKEYCGIGLSPLGSDILIGIGVDGSARWTYELPSGRQHPSLEQIRFGQLAGSAPHWIVAGPDGSLHFVSNDGKKLDSFNHGAPLDGFAPATIDGKPALLISSGEGFTAWSVEPKED